LLVLSTFLLSIASAQSHKKKPEKEFIDKLWVGGSINNNLRFGGGSFAFALTPMVGYELVPRVSVGPFVRLDYHYQRYGFARPYSKYQSFDVGPGVFARVDVIQNFFAQVEYEHAFIQAPVTNEFGEIQFDNDLKALKETEVQHYVYVGAGYASGTNVRYGISLHYNILDDFNYIRFPWDYRITIRVQL
jgi:hypothetical protein